MMACLSTSRGFHLSTVRILIRSFGRYFPYFITVASTVLVFVGLLLYLIFQRRLLPSIVMLGGFMLFILWLVGLIVISIQLWGPTGSVSSNCNLSVFNQNPTGQTLNTLAWLEQKTICAYFVVGRISGERQAKLTSCLRRQVNRGRPFLPLPSSAPSSSCG